MIMWVPSSLRDDINLEWDPIVVAEAVGAFLAHHEAHTILTFDRMGVSGHPNHISLFKGAARLYSGPMMPLYYYFARILRPQNDTIYVSGPHGYLTALKAMQQHSSQLVWFRWLYVLFSCYMWVNVWESFVFVTRSTLAFRQLCKASSRREHEWATLLSDNSAVAPRLYTRAGFAFILHFHAARPSTRVGGRVPIISAIPRHRASFAISRRTQS
ncbi:hypothetical protein BS47DRAFT_1347109 [Hydnum rufescens UP504]|uniref:N-acetylglucosaminylphosphatidylinositol deacetylase n=1 Tax=Hydnum rufescens UP504 TaxID=1448309 RepID=A0A9P6ASI5_9AGAM|nr:hypothetical protein BS47DRAFT_1347109 [Hydnum rufescens UP504]